MSMAFSRKRPYDYSYPVGGESRRDVSTAPNPVAAGAAGGAAVAPMMNGGSVSDVVEELWGDDDDGMTADDFDICERLATQVVQSQTVSGGGGGAGEHGSKHYVGLGTHTGAGSTVAGTLAGPLSTITNRKHGENQPAINLDRIQLQELERLRHEITVKNGEISVLRDSLQRSNGQITKLKDDKMKQINCEIGERGERERRLRSELDGLRTQLQFKERELVEAGDRLKRHQQQQHQDTASRQVSPSVSDGTSIMPPRANEYLAAASQQPQPSRPTFDTFHFVPPTQSTSTPATAATVFTRPPTVASATDGAPSKGIEEQVEASRVDQTSKTVKLRNKFKLPTSSSTCGALPGSKVVHRLLHSANTKSPLSTIMNWKSQLDDDRCDVEKEAREAHYHRAMEAVNRLILEDGGGSSSNQAALAATSCGLELPPESLVPDCKSVHVVELLPVIGDILSSYLRGVGGTAARSPGLRRRVTARVTKGEAAVVDGSSGGRCVVAACDAESVLSVLRVLVQSSALLRDRLLAHHEHTTPSPATSQQGSESTEVHIECSEVVCVLLHTLRVCVLKPHLHSPASSAHPVLLGVLDVLLACSHNVDVSRLASMSPMLMDGTLVSYLSGDATSLPLCNKLLRLLQLLAHNHHVLRLITQHTESCTLSHIYSLASRSVCQNDKEHLHLAFNVINVITTLVSCRSDGLESVLDEHCHCTDQCVRSVCEMLWHWLCLARDPSGNIGHEGCEDADDNVTALLVSRGTALLHVLTRHRPPPPPPPLLHNVNKHEYLSLVNTMTALATTLREKYQTHISQFEMEALRELSDIDDSWWFGSDAQGMAMSESLDTSDCEPAGPRSHAMDLQ